MKTIIKESRPYILKSKLAATIFIFIFASVGTYILFHSFAYGTTNATQLDNGTCGTNEQIGSDNSASWTATPTFLLNGDGGAPAYSVTIDGNTLTGPGANIGGVNYPGAWPGDNYGNVCITDNIALSNGAHQFEATELRPNPSNTVPPFNFSVDTTPPVTPSGLSLNPSTDTGIKGDDLTTSTSLMINGNGTTGDPVDLYSAGKLIGGGPTSSNGSWVISTITLVPGVYSITAISLNKAGVASSVSSPLSVTIANPVPPTVSITNPSNNSLLSGSVNLTSNSSDSVYPIWNVQYELNGSLLGQANTSPFSYTWPSYTFDTPLNGSTDSLVAIATDTLGDSTKSSPITFTYEYQPKYSPPSIPGTPLTTSPTTSTSPVWTWTASTDSGGPGLSATPYTVQWSQSSTFASGTSSSTSATNSFTTPNLSIGTWYMRVAASDSSGDTSAYSPVGSVVIQANPPTVPGTPTTTSPTNNTSPTWTWTASVDNGGSLSTTPYNIQYSEDSTFSTGVSNATSSTNTYTTSGLTNGAWYMRISANNSIGQVSAYSPVGQVFIDLSSPTVSISYPANGSTLAGIVQVDSTDTDSSGIAKVQLYIDGSLAETDTSYPYNFSWDTTSVINGSHNILVEAFDNIGNPPTSQQISVNVSNSPITPTTPTMLSATSSVYNQVNLSWTASTETGGSIAGYYVFRNTANNITGSTTIAITNSPSTTYTDSSVNGSTAYYYWVMAYDGKGNKSSPSSSAMVTTPANPNTSPPVAPTNLGGSAISDSQVNLSWIASTSSNVVGYNIYRGTSSTTISSTPINESTIVTTKYGDTSLSPITTYYYYVEAVNSYGVASSPSNTIKVTTQVAPPINTTVEGTVTVRVNKINQPLGNVLVHTNKGGAGGMTTTNTNQYGQYLLNNIVSNVTHRYVFSLKGYKTKSTKVDYPVGIVTLNETLKAK